MGETLCPCVSDFIVRKVECGESLCEKCRWSRERRLEDDVHRVVCESIGEMLCPCVSDFIVRKAECGECLCEKADGQEVDE